MTGNTGHARAHARRVIGCLLVFAAALCQPAGAGDCLVVAHRGASGYVPEHTLAAYRLAIELGADYIEPDLVLTRDGIPVARHENLLQLTTDVARRPEFAARRREAEIGGKTVRGWFSEDFTLIEIRSLRAIERFPEERPGSASQDGQYAIPTLQEVIELVNEVERESGRRVGLYPELKQPAYFLARGLDVVSATIDVLRSNGLDSPADAVLIQSFDAEALLRASELTRLRLVRLLWAEQPKEIGAAVSPAVLRKIAAYAHGIGVPKYGFVFESDAPPFSPTSLISNAHAAGLFVHVYTFRAENEFLPEKFRVAGQRRGRLEAELRLFLSAGIDGFFIDQPDIGRRACSERDPR